MKTAQKTKMERYTNPVRVEDELYEIARQATENGRKQHIQYYLNDCIRIGMQKKGDL